MSEKDVDGTVAKSTGGAVVIVVIECAGPGVAESKTMGAGMLSMILHIS